MNMEKAAEMLKKELAAKGITEEEIINAYGSIENWIESVTKLLKIVYSCMK